PYAASKASADFLALSYYRSFGLNVTVVRPFNTYGPRQSARAVIPTIVSQVLDGKKTISLGNLTPTRDLTFVSDTVSGFLAAAGSSGAVGQTVNLGTGSEISIGGLAGKILSIIGADVEIRSDDQRIRPSKSEVERLLSNPSKMSSLTGWSAEISLDEGLKRTVEWMKDRRQLYKSGIYNV
ncbi:MAG: GDP-mannose 4,6-dehydratase, partial [Synergistota bacterium]|nr:GDP-mannose 4,6-dehydratase [Synergistota bacterium]